MHILPRLAAIGSCLQCFPLSMYNPVNAIKPFLFATSPFINTYCIHKTL